MNIYILSYNHFYNSGGVKKQIMQFVNEKFIINRYLEKLYIKRKD